MNRLVAVFCAACAAGALAQPEQQLARERCATRLAGNLTGRTPREVLDGGLLAAPSAQDLAPALLETPLFVERFSNYSNAEFNIDRADFPQQEASLYLARKVLTERKPWRDLFLGRYVFLPAAGNQTQQQRLASLRLPPDIREFAADAGVGLGYFGSPEWRTRYAGNEAEGFRLVHAYRVLNNVIGLRLAAAVNTDGVNAAGRQAASCAGCHYRPDFGLDLVARVLPLRNRVLPADAPQTLLNGQVIANERELLERLVASPNFTFNACRLAIRFATGRPEYACEGPVFDACMQAFQQTGSMQSALQAITQHPSFCQ